MIATIVPARNALTMKWNASALRTSSTRFHVSRPLASASNVPASVSSMAVAVVQVGVEGRGLGMPDDDEAPVGGVAAPRSECRTTGSASRW